MRTHRHNQAFTQDNLYGLIVTRLLPHAVATELDTRVVKTVYKNVETLNKYIKTYSAYERAAEVSRKSGRQCPTKLPTAADIPN